jgi:Fe2+ transport system protein FeoA
MTTGNAASHDRVSVTDARAEAGSHPNMTGKAMPLPMLRPGQTACVERVLAAGQGMVRTLSAIGIIRGVHVTVLTPQPGPLLLRVGESRYAIGRGVAQRILVVPCH